MKPPCIITFHNAINEGAMLQCAFLSELMKQHSGTQPYVLNYQDRVRRDAFANHPSQRCLMAFCRSALRLSPRFDDLDEAANWVNENASVAICGSDEIWKWPHRGCDPKFYAPIPSIYFGAGIHIRKVAYAVSVGDSDLSKCPAIVADLVRQFDVVSVRDEKSKRFVQQFRDVSVVPDPTLGMDLKEVFPDCWDQARAIAPSNPFTYFTDPHRIQKRDFPKEVVGSTITTMPSKFENVGPVSPPVWAALHGLASLVVTQRYHSTITAMRFATPVFVFANRNKVKEITSQFGIQSRKTSRWAFDTNTYVQECQRQHGEFLSTILP